VGAIPVGAPRFLANNNLSPGSGGAPPLCCFQGNLSFVTKRVANVKKSQAADSRS
jgi:hypothetical protein